MDLKHGDRVQVATDYADREFRGKVGEVVETRNRSRWGHEPEALVQIDDGPRWWFFESGLRSTSAAHQGDKR